MEVMRRTLDMKSTINVKDKHGKNKEKNEAMESDDGVGEAYNICVLEKNQLKKFRMY